MSYSRQTCPASFGNLSSVLVTRVKRGEDAGTLFRAILLLGIRLFAIPPTELTGATLTLLPVARLADLPAKELFANELPANEAPFQLPPLVVPGLAGELEAGAEGL